MNRRVFNLLTGLSLVLCVVSVVLWPLSYMGHSIIALDGRLYVAIAGGGDPTVADLSGNLGDPRRLVVSLEYSATVRRSFLGFEFCKGTTNDDLAGGPSTTFWLMAAPLWFLLCAASALPVVWFSVYLLFKRHQGRRCCATCGYDLRATPDCCPECGTVPPSTLSTT